MHLINRAAIALLLLALPGCAAVAALEDASRSLEIYELRTPAITPGAGGRRDIEVTVEEPSAGGALASERIMIRPGPLRAQYLSGVRWADPAPVMLQTLLLRSLIATEAVGSAGRRPIGTTSDYAILSELTDFQAETVDGAGATVRIGLIVRLVDEREARVIARRSFSGTEAAESAEAERVIAAFDRASARVLTEVVNWLIESLGAA